MEKKAGFIIKFTMGMVILLLMVAIAPSATAATQLTNFNHIFINVANDAGVKWNLDGAHYSGPNNTYYIKGEGFGLNESPYHQHKYRRRRQGPGHREQ